MRKTEWTDDRLRQHFDRYRRRYWPDAPLPQFEVVLGHARHGLAECDWRKRRIIIHAEGHESDYEVRESLLHEMIHAVVDTRARRSLRHDPTFYAELRRTERAGAPIRLWSQPDFKRRITATQLRALRGRLAELRR